MSFEQLALHPNLLKAIETCGYTKATPVQAKAIPVILSGQDLVACAQTGTGKTAAFVLPALNRLAGEKPNKKTRILILTPTRELATQVTKAVTTYGKFSQFSLVNLVGGMPYHQQIRDLSRGADIIVATPGRLLDHMEQKRVNLHSVEMLVLDEADRMLDMGFIEDVEYIANLTPANRQTLLFSATLDKNLQNVVRHLLKNPVRIDLSNEKLAAPQIKQTLYKTPNSHYKMRLLQHLMTEENIFKAIVFSATKINADKLAISLRDAGFAAAALHGDLKQNVRNRTLDAFRRGKTQILVATDVAARGIDIDDLTHVINYDLPRFCEDYVHRIGRTGRAGKEGAAISFVSPTDMRHLQRIERYIGQHLKFERNVDVPNTPIHRLEESGEKRSDYADFSDDDMRRDKRSGSPRKKYSDSPARETSYTRDKAAKRDGYASRDKSAKRDGYASRDKAASRDKFPSRDKSTSRDKFPSRDKAASRDKFPSRDKATTRDKFPSRDKAATRDKFPSRDKAATRDKATKRDAFPARDTFASRDKFSSRKADAFDMPRKKRVREDEEAIGLNRDDESPRKIKVHYKPSDEGRFKKDQGRSRPGRASGKKEGKAKSGERKSYGEKTFAKKGKAPARKSNRTERSRSKSAR